MQYLVLKLQDLTQNSLQGILDRIKEVTPSLKARDVLTWGIFPGLFGLASNELYWVVMMESEVDVARVFLKPGIAIRNEWHLTPTVRPTVDASRDKEGVYVFRWFTIPNKSVEEAAALSAKAWETFESDFGTEVQALFAEQSPEGEIGTMLLVTWYTDLSVWQKSRQPDPAARAHFYKRSQLMQFATPIATRLYLPE